VCGIHGALRLSPRAPRLDREELLRTREQMALRGPDGAGLWLDREERVALGSRRLAILDLSPAGAQPMASPDGRLHMVHNGEIYNFRELRAELAARGVQFRTGSDTELLLAAYRAWGVGMLPRLRGMYGFAIWDADEGSLLLARDPFGIKPLYYAVADGVLRFASQVKALLAGGGVSDEVDLGAVAGFLVWGSVPDPRTLRAAVRALPAGHYLLARGGAVSQPLPHPSGGAETGGTGHDPGSSPDRSLAGAFADSVTAHLVSDVPVAVFLSAGLDSALVAALARRGAPELASLTVRFTTLRGSAADEGPVAAELAAALGTRHREVEVGPDELRGLWPAALAAMDQPSIDGFNTYVLARKAREAGFAVVLSGLGGDELLGGYPSFRDIPRALRVARLGRRVPGLATLWPHLPSGARPKAAGLLRYGASLPGAYLLRRGLFLPEELPGLLGTELAAEALRWYDPLADAAAALAEPAPELDSMPGAPDADDPWLAVHRLETSRYMRHQLLRDGDWASMAHSVELRVPLVDSRLRRAVAAAGFEPARSGGKAALVRSVAPEVPAAVLERPKTGFYVPLVEALEPGAAETHGGRSRALAVRVLREHGIDLPLAAAPSRPRNPAAAG
jgi:asparagine synthase (glutamine-hydrolysing)